MALEIVCEWIERTGGAERVLDAMVDAFPGAPVHTLWNDAEERMAGVDVRESWLSRTPLRRSKALALPFFDPTWRRLRAVGAPDRLLISSYVFAHHARIRGLPDVRKYVYVHSPARYIWAPEIDPRGRNPLMRATAPYWRSLDRRRAAEAHSLAVNSAYVRDRVRHVWGRDAQVIHPPVDTAAIRRHATWADVINGRDADVLDSLPRDFILGASRLVRYKGLDEVLRFAEAVDLPVVIAGEGPDVRRLSQMVSTRSVTATFLGPVSDELLYALYQRAAAYVFPPIEDFGLMPVEAMAAGARVIVNSVGGTAESVLDGSTGVHTTSFRDTAARNAFERAQRIDTTVAIARAQEFSRERFIGEIIAWADSSSVGYEQ